MRVIFYILVSIASVFVIYSNWEDIWWDIEYYIDELPFISKEEDFITGIPVDGELEVSDNRIQGSIYIDDEMSTHYLQISHLSSRNNENLRFYNEFEHSFVDGGLFSINSACYGKAVNFSIIDIKNNFVSDPVFEHRVFLAGFKPLFIEGKRILLVVYIDEDTNEDTKLSCNDKQKLLLYNLDDRESIYVDYSFESLMRSIRLYSHTTLLVNSNQRFGKIPLFVELTTGAVRSAVPEGSTEKIEEILNRKF